MKHILSRIFCSLIFLFVVLPYSQAREVPPERGKFALIIGIKGYPNFPEGEKLHYADEDAKDFAAFIQTPEGGAFPKNNIHLLLNENAHRGAILRELSLLGREVSNNDQVYIYFAGHGVVDDPAGYAYFMPYDAEKSSPSEKGIRADHFLQELKTKINAKHMVIFIDACHAAAVLMPDGVARGGANITSKLLEMWDKELSGREGVTMGIFSASSNQRAWEDHSLKHGVFTFHLLEGLRGRADEDMDGTIRARELYRYVMNKVEEHSRKRFTVQTPAKTPLFDPEYPLALHGASPTRNKVPNPAESQPKEGTDEVCQAIMRIVEASHDDFNSLAVRGSFGSLESAINIPGFSSSSVSLGNDAIFRMNLRNLSEVKMEYSRLVSKLDKCFSRWERIELPGGIDGNEISYRRHLLSEGKEGSAIEVSHSLSQSETTLRLAVYSPKSGMLKLMRAMQLFKTTIKEL